MNDINFKTIQCQVAIQMLAENLPDVLKHKGNYYEKNPDTKKKAEAISNNSLILNGRFWKVLTQEEKDEFNLSVLGSYEKLFKMLFKESTPEDVDTYTQSIEHYLNTKIK